MTRRGRPSGGPYIVRRKPSGPNGDYETYHITVPGKIGRVIPEGAQFLPELTEEGILFRRVEPEEIPVVELPSWVTGNGAES